MDFGNNDRNEGTARVHTHNKKGRKVSDRALVIIGNRSEQRALGNHHRAMELTKALRKQIRRDRRAQVLVETAQTLEVKDRWLGVKQPRKDHTPKV